MKIILVRHGETVDDITDCYGGYADFDLSDNGRKTAEALSIKLKGEKINKIVSSPLKRAIQTAEFLNKVQKCGIEIAGKLYERNSYGIMSGSNKDECKSIFGWLLKDFKGKVGDYYSTETFVGSEPVKDFDTRIKKQMIEIVEKYNEFKTIAIVAHGNVTKSIYKQFLKVTGKVDLDLLAITIIDYQNGKFTLISNEGVTINK